MLGIALLVVAGQWAAGTLAAAIHPRDDVPAGYVAAPAYPAPHGGWTPDWAASYAKAYKLVSRMTLAEKVNISSGTGIFMGPCVGNTGSAPSVNFPQLCIQDGPLGVRSTDNITAFPAGITTGATWDKDLILARGEALGKEFKGKGIHVYLGPSVGPLGRKPRGGRNWEGFGSDPVLQAIAGAQTIKGVQSQGVIATIKHLIANEQEMYRMYNPTMAAYSANVDDRTMHELYLWPFADGVHAGVGSVMGAYNAINGSNACQNSYMLNRLLKDELGFQGFVMSDWLAQISGVASALAGLDMAMPGDTMVPLFGNSYWMYELTRSALNGSVPIDRINDMATRIVAAWYQMGQDVSRPVPNFSANTANREGPLYPGSLFSPSGVVNQYVNVQADHWKIARQVAQDGITLLKNDGELLPLLSPTRPLKVFGTGAAPNPDGINSCTDKSCNKGTLGMGWGSGSANYPYMDSPIDALRRVASDVTYYQTDNFPSSGTLGAAKDEDVAIVFISSDSGENSYSVLGNHGDRVEAGIKAWYGGDELVKRAAARYKSVIVVVHTVGPILLEDWIDLPAVKSVLFAHLPGQEAGTSLSNVLFGYVSPSGHLPYSITKKENDYPDSISKLTGFAFFQPQDTYTEGLYIDYRYLNKHKITPRYAFGHGLSYTTFSFTGATITAITPLTKLPPLRPAKLPIQPYSTTIPPSTEAHRPKDVTDAIWRYLYPWLSPSDAAAAAAVAQSGKKYAYPAGYSTTQTAGVPAGGAQGGNPALWDVAFKVSVTVTNTGKRPGRAVAQAYVQFPGQGEIGYDTPVIQLRDFEKTRTLAPGETQVLTLVIRRRDVSVWDVVAQNWVVPKVGARYRVWVGEGSDVLGLVCNTDELKCSAGVKSPV